MKEIEAKLIKAMKEEGALELHDLVIVLQTVAKKALSQETVLDFVESNRRVGKRTSILGVTRYYVK